MDRSPTRTFAPSEQHDQQESLRLHKLQQAVQRTVDLGYEPRPWADALHRVAHNYKNMILICGRRTGKTHFAAMEIISRALEMPDSVHIWLSPLLIITSLQGIGGRTTLFADCATAGLAPKCCRRTWSVRRCIFQTGW